MRSFAVCVLAACSPPHVASPVAPTSAPAATPGVISNSAPAAKPTHEELATIDRTGCFGWCPIYKLTVFRDGTVEYSGERFVKTTGAATWTVTPAEIAAIDALFADATTRTSATSTRRTT